jgi:glycosyltransferase involved in cell wall biosynthesis
MRILVASNNRFLMGGAEHYLRMLIPGLRDRGHDVALVYENLAPPDVPTIDQGWEGFLSWRYEQGDFPGLLKKLLSWQPDVVYSHGVSLGLENRLVEHFPTVLCAHGYFGTCISGSKYRSRLSPKICERRFGPACLALYLPCGCGGLNPLTMWRFYRQERRRQALLARYRMVLVASRHMQAEYARHGLSPSRLHWTPHFPSSVRPDLQPPSPRSLSHRILFVARLSWVKGGHLLVDALAQLGGDWVLVVVGSGPEKEPLQALAKRRGVRAEFLGQLDTRQLEQQRRTADLAAVPSLWPEPFGLVGIEAGCVGLPAVGFLNGGIADWLIPGETGEAPPKGQMTATGLAEAIERAVKDPDHYQRLRVGAWQMARQFTLERHLDLLVPLLEQACR